MSKDSDQTHPEARLIRMPITVKGIFERARALGNLSNGNRSDTFPPGELPSDLLLRSYPRHTKEWRTTSDDTKYPVYIGETRINGVLLARHEVVHPDLNGDVYPQIPREIWGVYGIDSDGKPMKAEYLRYFNPSALRLSGDNESNKHVICFTHGGSEGQYRVGKEPNPLTLEAQQSLASTLGIESSFSQF